MLQSLLGEATLAQYEREVTDALMAIGNPRLGQAIQQDRGSGLQHLGISFPNLRKRVKVGFTFYALPAAQILQVWDHLWHNSPVGDVLFAALEYYAPLAKKRTIAAPDVWPRLKTWVERVDNWCHSDGLSAIYAWLLAEYRADVYAQLAQWNRADDQWKRRASLVSLIHYSGKNAVFLPTNMVLPMVTGCVRDHRLHLQTAVGWVLREMGHVYPVEIDEYLLAQGPQMGKVAFGRAIERRSAEKRAQLKAALRPTQNCLT